MQYKPLPDAVITILAGYNPKRLGSAARRRFDRYRTGMTVREFLEAGGLLGDIHYDIGHGFIAVSDYPYSEILTRMRQGGTNAQSPT